MRRRFQHYRRHRCGKRLTVPEKRDGDPVARFRVLFLKQSWKFMQAIHVSFYVILFLVALALTRELGPVVTALLYAGRAGTSLTAEIGLMKAGEQLSAMDMMAVNPIKRILAPRFWAGVVSMPILATIFSAAGVIGGYVVGVLLIGVDDGAFWSQMQEGVDVWNDIGNGVVKSLVFGFAVTFMALFQGYESRPTPEGVSSATTRTVVYSSLLVLWLDFIMTALMFN